MESPQTPIGQLNGSNGDLIKQPRSQAAGGSASIDLRGRPVNMSKTGTWKAAGFFYALVTGDFQASIGVAITLVQVLALNYYQPVATSANITTEYLGSSFLLAVLGGFIADSYLGPYYSIVLGGMIMTLGLSLLTATATVKSLIPPACLLPPIQCRPAGIQYMAPLYTALYTIALGTGIVRPTLVSLGGGQFDESLPGEKKQSVHFYVWFYFFANAGLILTFTLGVYLQGLHIRGWGYAYLLMFYVIAYGIFLAGTPRMRHKRPAGSFLTRMFQVFVAAIRKWKSWMPEDPQHLYKGSGATPHTNKLRFLDRAAIIDEGEKGVLVDASYRPNPWRLCSVTQIEESKRIFQLLPIWATTTIVTLVFSQLATFTLQVGMTLDRHIGDFEVPVASQGVIMIVTALLVVPIYDWVVVPIARRYTGNPYGLTPLRRIGIALVFAIISMIAAALVERTRLSYIRELQWEKVYLGPKPLGRTLPMTFWWLAPIFVCTALVEFFFYIAAYQFFYHEVSETTRSIGSSFTYSSAAMGYFWSVIVVNLVESLTAQGEGGSWLNGLPGGQLQNGGLEKFYWLLTAIMAIVFILFLICAHVYEYRHDWYEVGQSPEAAGKEWPDAIAVGIPVKKGAAALDDIDD